MKAAKHLGKCTLCGQLKDLTEEHIPPKNAFNSCNVTVLPFNEIVKALSGADGRLPWDTKGLRGSIQQGGNKRRCPCKECNNNTGAWYIKEYTEFAKKMHIVI